MQSVRLTQEMIAHLLEHRMDYMDKKIDAILAKYDYVQSLARRFHKYEVVNSIFTVSGSILAGLSGALGITGMISVVGVPLGIAFGVISLLFGITSGTFFGVMKKVRSVKKKHKEYAKEIFLKIDKLRVIRERILSDGLIEPDELNEFDLIFMEEMNDVKYLVKKVENVDKEISLKLFLESFIHHFGSEIHENPDLIKELKRLHH